MIVEIAIGILLGYILIMLLPILIVSLPILIVGGLIVVLALLLIVGSLFGISLVPIEAYAFTFCGVAAFINIYAGFILYQIIVGACKSVPNEREKTITPLAYIILFGMFLLFMSPVHFFICWTGFSIFLICGYKEALSS